MPDIVVTATQWRTTVGPDIKDSHSLQAARDTLATTAGQQNLRLTVYTATTFGGRRTEVFGPSNGRAVDAHLESRGWLAEARIINKSLRIDDKSELLPACQQIAEAVERNVQVGDEFGEYTVTAEGLEIQAAIPSPGWISIDGYDIQVITGQERQQLINYVQGQAQALRTSVSINLRDGNDHMRLTVAPDGQVEETPMYDTPPQPAYAPTPPQAAQYPVQGQIQQPTTAQPAYFPTNQGQTSYTPIGAQAPAVEPQRTEPAFEYENDPEWQEWAAKPAESGLWGWLNSTVKSKIGPKPAELEQRREEFIELQKTRAEEARRAAEAERQAEEERRLEAERESRRQARERERQAHNAELDRDIQTNFEEPKTILVANPKGGSRKTTTTYTFGATFGISRGGYTVAWDNNETMGTLGKRSRKDRHSRTVVDLLEQGAKYFRSDEARIGALDAYVRQQGSTHFHVLASDENAARQDQIDGEGYQVVHDILERFYRIILVDTGNNIRREHFVQAVESADQLIIPVAAAEDSKDAALDMMTHLEVTGHGKLVENAVVLIHELEPIYRDDSGNAVSGNGHEVMAKEVADEFEGRVAAVLPIPYDPGFKEGKEIDYFNLSAATIDAYREACAAASRSIIATMND